jgi:hypothetical protein
MMFHLLLFNPCSPFFDDPSFAGERFHILDKE